MSPQRPLEDGNTAFPLIQVAYISERLPDCQMNMLGLLDSYAMNNPACGLTGMLLVSDTHYFQLLEGPQDAVHRAIGEIRRDLRYVAMCIVNEMQVDTRSVPEWSMAICEVKVEAGQYALNNALLNSHGTSLEKMVLPGHARDLLQGFCEGVTFLA